MFFGLRRAIFDPSGGPGRSRPPSFFAAHNHGILMRDIFTEIVENRPLDPAESARRGPKARRRAQNPTGTGTKA